MLTPVGFWLCCFQSIFQPHDPARWAEFYWSNFFTPSANKSYIFLFCWGFLSKLYYLECTRRRGFGLTLSWIPWTHPWPRREPLFWYKWRRLTWVSYVSSQFWILICIWPSSVFKRGRDRSSSGPFLCVGIMWYLSLYVCALVLRMLSLGGR